MTASHCDPAVDARSHAAASWRVGRERVLPLDVPRLIGILNITPDSFSDGGRFTDASAAVDAALAMIDAGAAVIDVGGESTRPGAQRIDVDEQVRRTVPVIERLRAQRDTLISIDTTRAAVARAALNAGADIINDVSAGEEDDAIFDLAAERGCGLILMHRLRPPDRDRYSNEYDAALLAGDVVAAVRSYLDARAAAAVQRGIAREAIVIDPGLGFGKTVAQNYELIHRAGELVATGVPVLSAASRKSFIGAASGVAEPSRRLAGSLAVSVAHRLAGVQLFRVHDVAAHREALAVAAAICAAEPSGR